MSEKEVCAVFAKNLRSFLEANNMTQTDLAKRVGAGAATVNDWVKGRNIPRTPMLDKLTEIFDCRLSDLLTTAATESELEEYLEVLRTRPECRILFSVAKDATKEDVEKAVAIIEALRRTEGR